MRFLLRLVAWALPAFLLTWWVREAHQDVVIALAARLAAPAGAEIEVVDVEVFYPFELGMYVALCFASAFLPWRRRLRALALGTPILMLTELFVLVVCFRVLMAEGAGDAAVRLVDAIVRTQGMVAAVLAWGLIVLRPAGVAVLLAPGGRVGVLRRRGRVAQQ